MVQRYTLYNRQGEYQLRRKNEKLRLSCRCQGLLISSMTDQSVLRLIKPLFVSPSRFKVDAAIQVSILAGTVHRHTQYTRHNGGNHSLLHSKVYCRARKWSIMPSEGSDIQARARCRSRAFSAWVLSSTDERGDKSYEDDGSVPRFSTRTESDTYIIQGVLKSIPQ